MFVENDTTRASFLDAVMATETRSDVRMIVGYAKDLLERVLALRKQIGPGTIVLSWPWMLRVDYDSRLGRRLELWCHGKFLTAGVWLPIVDDPESANADIVAVQAMGGACCRWVVTDFLTGKPLLEWQSTRSMAVDPFSLSLTVTLPSYKETLSQPRP